MSWRVLENVLARMRWREVRLVLEGVGLRDHAAVGVAEQAIFPSSQGAAPPRRRRPCSRRCTASYPRGVGDLPEPRSSMKTSGSSWRGGRGSAAGSRARRQARRAPPPAAFRGRPTSRRESLPRCRPAPPRSASPRVRRSWPGWHTRRAWRPSRGRGASANVGSWDHRSRAPDPRSTEDRAPPNRPAYSASATSPPPQPSIHREAILGRRHHQEEEQQRGAGNDVGVELVEWLEEQVPEGHEHQHCPQRQERLAESATRGGAARPRPARPRGPSSPSPRAPTGEGRCGRTARRRAAARARPSPG